MYDLFLWCINVMFENKDYNSGLGCLRLHVLHWLQPRKLLVFMPRKVSSVVIRSRYHNVFSTLNFLRIAQTPPSPIPP